MSDEVKRNGPNTKEIIYMISRVATVVAAVSGFVYSYFYEEDSE